MLSSQSTRRSRASASLLTLATLLSLCLLLAAFTPVVQAGVYITAPDAKTKEKGGTSMDIAWRDDHKKPKLANWGNLTIYLATGSASQQFMLQKLGSDIRPNAKSFKAKINPGVGDSSNQYFIRIVGSSALSDGSHPESFSARFSLSKMTGKFNSTIQSSLGKGASSLSSSSAAGAGASGTKTSPAAGSPSANATTASTYKPAAAVTSTLAGGAGPRVRLGAVQTVLMPWLATVLGLAMSLAAGVALL
ncbi:hypothetical protein OC846_004132 [Tilletia horrida]|uniref:Yeast cell wall synthesis Kre9/Knh1-like N-terminal domain-containing protein n=1 Tax=Tilletia horrida TaxID=155126 RepID=A0AAN6GN62_9BASI|nr:hypothetical protein OC845_004223 [Tilletia horrida]KAK0549306.1 hypothetical protein OC846_004132 [Tilletia horrida]KAK0564132.1 hypothetical protein OC861_004445 [Tilletia horrida]